MVTDNVTCAVNKQFETWKGNLAAIIDINKYNCINKLLRITAHVLKFVRRDRKSGALDVEDIAKARKMWVITEQKLQKKLQPLAFLKSKASLGLYLEDHVMRCRGRILNSDLPYDTKCPIYIYRKTDNWQNLSLLMHTQKYFIIRRNLLWSKYEQTIGDHSAVSRFEMF